MYLSLYLFQPSPFNVQYENYLSTKFNHGHTIYKNQCSLKIRIMFETTIWSSLRLRLKTDQKTFSTCRWIRHKQYQERLRTKMFKMELKPSENNERRQNAFLEITPDQIKVQDQDVWMRLDGRSSENEFYNIIFICNYILNVKISKWIGCYSYKM